MSRAFKVAKWGLELGCRTLFDAVIVNGVSITWDFWRGIRRCTWASTARTAATAASPGSAGTRDKASIQWSTKLTIECLSSLSTSSALAYCGVFGGQADFFTKVIVRLPLVTSDLENLAPIAKNTKALTIASKYIGCSVYSGNTG